MQVVEHAIQRWLLALTRIGGLDMDRRTIAAVVGLVLIATGVASLAIATNSDTSTVGPVDSMVLGTKIGALDRIQSLPEVSDTESVRFALEGVGEAQDASEARVLAKSDGAEVAVVGAPDATQRVCFATTGYRYSALCRDRDRLLEGRTVISVPLEPLTASTLATQRRIDFFVVPDEVKSVSTSDGTAAVIDNVASVERPEGGPVGAVTYEREDGRTITFEFAPATPIG